MLNLEKYMRYEESIENQYIKDQFNPATDKDEVFFSAMQELGPSGMSINLTEAGILKFLLRLVKAKRVVEIGCFAGFSAWQMSQVIPNDGEIISLEKNEEYYNRAIKNLSTVGAKNVRVLLGDALENLATLKGEFDLVFIDADKGSYLDYLKWAQDHLRVGGLVVCDNCFLFGAVFSAEKPENESQKRWQTMRAVNEYIAKSNMFNGIILPTKEGLLVAEKL